MTEISIVDRIQAHKEESVQLEADARTERVTLLERLRVVCEIAGLVPREQLDGIIAGRKRGPKTGAKKVAKVRKVKAAPEPA